MDAETFATVGGAIHREARAWAARWARVPLSDFEQHGWTIVLEAIEDYDPTRGATLVTFATRCCRRAFLNFAYQQTLAVHAPKNNEHRFAHLARRVAAETTAHGVDEAFGLYSHDLEAEVSAADVRARVREAVEVVAARAGAKLDGRGNQANQQNQEAIAGLLLGTTTPQALTETIGASETTWRRRRAAAQASVRAHLRSDPR